MLALVRKLQVTLPSRLPHCSVPRLVQHASSQTRPSKWQDNAGHATGASSVLSDFIRVIVKVTGLFCSLGESKDLDRWCFAWSIRQHWRRQRTYLCLVRPACPRPRSATTSSVITQVGLASLQSSIHPHLLCDHQTQATLSEVRLFVAFSKAVCSPSVVSCWGPRYVSRFEGSWVCDAAGARFTESGTLASGLAALAQPFKLRLARRSGSGPTLRDYSGKLVLIEPLASIAAIEDFLWPRVHRTSADIAEEQRRSQVSCQEITRSRHLSCSICRHSIARSLHLRLAKQAVPPMIQGRVLTMGGWN